MKRLLLLLICCSFEIAPGRGICFLDVSGVNTSTSGVSAPTYFASTTITGCEDGLCTVTDAASPVTITPPASMQQGDLVVVVQSIRNNTAPTFTVSTTGGQTWTDLAAGSGNYIYSRVHYCTFDGTWDETPAFSVDSAAGASYTVTMHVFRPGDGSAHSWAVDVAQTYATFSAPADPFDTQISGITTSNANAVALFIWNANDDIAFTLQTAGFTAANYNSSVYYVQNNGGSDQTMQGAYRIMASAGDTGAVASRQSGGNSPDSGLSLKVSFY